LFLPSTAAVFGELSPNLQLWKVHVAAGIDLIEILHRLRRVQNPVVRGQSQGVAIRCTNWCPQSIEDGLAECLAAWKAHTQELCVSDFSIKPQKVGPQGQLSPG
jgi:hypothetical protein